MKESKYQTYDDLPLFLNAKTVAEVLGVSPATSYELLHESDFPSLKIGNRIVAPKRASLKNKFFKRQILLPGLSERRDFPDGKPQKFALGEKEE